MKLINKIAIIINELAILKINLIIDYYSNNLNYKETELIFFCHEKLEENKDLKKENEIVYCNEINLFSKICNVLKDTKGYSAFTTADFLFADLKCENDFYFLKENNNSYFFIVANQSFWQDVNKRMLLLYSYFELIRTNYSMTLLATIVNSFFDNGIDLEGKICFCEEENILLESKNNMVLNITKG